MNTCVISCTLPLPTNYRITDILSFHVRDAQAVAEIVYADRLHKEIVWQGSPACFALRFLSQCAMGLEPHFPANHDDFTARCHQTGQSKPTPLLLRYRQDDYNCLHQDLYGDWIFPLQVVILLSEPNADFTGGKFILTEQRPRLQSRAEVVPLKQGDAGIFALHRRPVQGSRGYYRVNMHHHGVSRIRSGQRHTLGIIFHDAS